MRVLVVVDYQNDFVDGSLGSRDAVSIEANVRRLAESYLNSGGDVVFTMDTHGPGYLRTREGRMLPVEHCIEGSEGWRIHGSLEEISRDPRCKVICKETFGSVELMDVLKGYDEIEICGLVTNICVIANAVIARTANPEARVIVRRDCVASNDMELGEKALDVMASLQVEIL